MLPSVLLIASTVMFSWNGAPRIPSKPHVLSESSDAAVGDDAAAVFGQMDVDSGGKVRREGCMRDRHVAAVCSHRVQQPPCGRRVAAFRVLTNDVVSAKAVSVIMP